MSLAFAAATAFASIALESSAKRCDSGVNISQKNRTTLPWEGRHGKTDKVAGSGIKKSSDFVSSPNPLTDEASNDIPAPKAFFNSDGIIEIFFRLPKISQNASRMNFTSFSLMNSTTSFLSYIKNLHNWKKSVFHI
jgi:hypothetical protein